jgi:DNA-binding winged helix-turn-helix (wHTH) protein
MTTTPQRYVHISARGDRHRPTRARSPQGTTPGTVLSPRAVPSPRPVATETEARGFVVYVGMEESAAAAAGTSLTRLTSELRHYVESIVPDSQSAAAVAIAPAGAPGADLEVVRQVLGDPTNPAGTRPDLAHVPAAPPTRRHGLVIDLAHRQVLLDGEALHLTCTEFELLHYLLENRDRTIGRAELIDSLWTKSDAAPSERTIDVHIRRLRTKLGRLSGIVSTARGQGYRYHEHPDVTVRTAAEYTI